MKRSQSNKITNKYDDESLWEIFRSYMMQPKFLVKHHLDSYNHFIRHDIKNILNTTNNVFYLRQYGNKIYRNIIEFENIRLTDPVHIVNKQDIIITPQTARERNLTYESFLYVTAVQKQHIIDIYNNIENKIEIERKEILLAKIPVMIYSDLCILNKKEYQRLDNKYDNGGYFIIKGSEKICVCQERLAYNRIYVLKKTIGDIQEYVAEVTSLNKNDKFSLTNIRLHIKKNNIITVSLSIFKNTINIPVILLIYLCGIESDEQILNLIVQDTSKNLISEFIRPFFEYKTILDKSLNPIQEDQKTINIDNLYNSLKNYINKDIFGANQDIKNIDRIYIQNELKNNLLPFLGTNLVKKGYYICYMVNKLILTKIGHLELSDRDSYINKRLETTGSILSNVFNYSIKAMFMECENIFRKRIGNNLTALIKPPGALDFLKLDTFDKEFKSAFTIGEIKSMKRSGVFHVYKQVSYMDSLTHGRMIRTPVGSSRTASKLVPPRYVQNTQFGYICPVESPEGKNIGLVKFLSNACNITLLNKNEYSKVYKILNEFIINIDLVEHYNMYKYKRVFIDGDWVGFTNDPFELRSKFIKFRRNGVINYQISIRLDYDTLETHIQTDSGRFIRPLLIVENYSIKLPTSFIEKDKSWSKYKNSQFIEFIDIEESTTMLIALHFSYLDKNKKLLQSKKTYSQNELVFKNPNNIIKKYTHCEIHQLGILGIISSSLPFQNHNQAPKDTSTCKYIKQAIGIFNPAFQERFDKQALVLHYPQLPLVGTKIHEILRLNEMPTGQNAIVALACYGGSNQEDGLIINKSFIERGAFNLTYYKSYEASLQKNINTGKSDIFFKPNPQKVRHVKRANYNKLNDNGMINEETPVGPYDAIIGKLTPIVDNIDNMDKLYTDSSTLLKNNEIGVIDKVIQNIYNHENNELCKVRLRSTRPANIGDKFCYDDKTEILTINGWKFFNVLDYEDKIGMLNRGILEYTKPLEIMKFRHTDSMINLEGKLCNYCVTPNHKLYIKEKKKYKLKEAELLFQKSKEFRTSSRFMGTKLFRTNSRLFMHGLILSTGICRDNKIYIKNKMENIVNLLKKLNVKFRSSNNYIIISSLSIDSLIPKWLFKLSTLKIRYFINGIFNKNNEYYTSNSRIIDKIQQLIIHAGYQSNTIIKRTTYKITLIKSNVFYNQTHNLETRINYDGYVYCCTSKTGIICTRRKGITMWNGNSSRMGQKSTVGILFKHEDMPFTKDGLTPDIIMNPHAIPSRMSMGQIIECVLSKIGAIQGHDIDGSSFNKIDVDNFPKILKKYGYHETGVEELRCGLTGKKLTSKIFIGPTYYQRLKHMAEDKIHARGSDGPVSLLTRQPPKGRAQGGGLRIGEMERDCFIAHGMSLFLKEKMVDSVEKYTCYICDKCGILAHKKLSMDYYICPLCQNTKLISKINIPYNMKLLMQELMSIGLKLKLELDQNRYNYGS